MIYSLNKFTLHVFYVYVVVLIPATENCGLGHSEVKYIEEYLKKFVRTTELNFFK